MKKLAVFLVLIAGTLWGAIGVFVRYYQSLSFDSLQIVFIRVFISAVIFALFLLIFDRRLFVIKLKDLWCFIGTGIVSLALFSFSYFKAIELASLSVAAILLYTAPSFVMLFSVIFFKERLTVKKCICILMSFVGCAFVTDVVSGNMNVTLYGAMFGLLSGVCYALYSIFSRFAIDRGYRPLTITLYTCVFSSVAVMCVTDLKPVVTFATSSVKELLLCILFAVVSCVLPYLTYTLSLKYIKSSTASVIASVEPVVATVIGAVFFHESIDAFGYIGVLLVVISIVLINLDIKIKPKGKTKT